jgi:hypothetical protein
MVPLGNRTPTNHHTDRPAHPRIAVSTFTAQEAEAILPEGDLEDQDALFDMNDD